MQKRTLAVTGTAYTAAQRERIAAAAAAHGFEAKFYDDVPAAMKAAETAEILLTDSPELTRAAKALRWVCTPSAGVNQFAAPDAIASADAVLTNSSGAYGVTIAEHIVMAALALLRKLPDYDAIVRARGWRRDLPVRSIHGSRVTLLGTGDIGAEAAKRLAAFAPQRITGVNRSGRHPGAPFDEALSVSRLDEALPETDILVVSLPGTEETRHLLDARRLALLPDGALIVNVGRGTVIDQAALERELRAGRLCAALDVFEEEPIPAGDSLWECPNLLITPHVAGNMTLPYTVERIVAMFLEDFENYCAGRPLARRVDLERGY